MVNGADCCIVLRTPSVHRIWGFQCVWDSDKVSKLRNDKHLSVTVRMIVSGTLPMRHILFFRLTTLSSVGIIHDERGAQKQHCPHTCSKISIQTGYRVSIASCTSSVWEGNCYYATISSTTGMYILLGSGKLCTSHPQRRVCKHW